MSVPDRFPTCGLCRVKGARPPRVPMRHPAPHHIVATEWPWQTEATRCCVWQSEASFLANLWQTALRAKVGATLRLVELTGFEPLTPCMPSRNPDRSSITKPRITSHHIEAVDVTRGAFRGLVWLELLPRCCPPQPSWSTCRSLGRVVQASAVKLL
jgi:hypothetical protein